MAFDLNNISIIGRLVRDPELRHANNGTPVCTFSIANNQGKSQEDVSFFDVVTFARQAELANEYLRKGRQIALVGRIKQDRWEDQNGQKRSKVVIVANTVSFIGGNQQGGDDSYDGGSYTSSSQSSTPSEPPASTPSSSSSGSSEQYNGPEYNEDDDIPF